MYGLVTSPDVLRGLRYGVAAHRNAIQRTEDETGTALLVQGWDNNAASDVERAREAGKLRRRARVAA